MENLSHRTAGRFRRLSPKVPVFFFFPSEATPPLPTLVLAAVSGLTNAAGISGSDFRAPPSRAAADSRSRTEQLIKFSDQSRPLSS